MTHHKEIREIIEEFLKNLSVSFDSVDEVFEPWGTTYMIKTKDAPLLIGAAGANLLALNHLLKRLIEKKLGNDLPRFAIDVNNYQTKRNEELRHLAKEAARKAKDEKIKVELQPMSPYERMVVHSTLAEEPDIETNSVGEGKERHLVVTCRNT